MINTLSELYPCLKQPDRPPRWLIVAALAALTLIIGLITARAENQTQVIARVIAAEAAGEGMPGMQAVANTIANRARQRGLTAYQVVIQPNQYYGLTARNAQKLYAQVKSQADYLAANIMRLKDITGGALYYRRKQEKLFPWCKVFTIRIKNHLFYK